ncbi:MAG: hypothetical protein K5798_06670 [Nitrosopumilus sp.]|uniref:Uncharacterized protein n=1 Tax=Nitrosopumilus zosterae TaxID=718286 RepID=A0A2S2KSU4_9ARCH|nr:MULTISPECIES: hypothetical protein [Nitrosopumilus]MCV0366926.1 hypothetical protein [Nitrosopumilus sp.]BDQ30869.1 hypothetical protein NZOSNM25_000977 [Nitrosopumilus zosterae]GBH34515.1 hypothetical protein NZNM25_13060 [Nitrosopumilus zosterae]
MGDDRFTLKSLACEKEPIHPVDVKKVHSILNITYTKGDNSMVQRKKITEEQGRCYDHPK